MGFPGGSVVKNLHTSAEDEGSIPGPGRPQTQLRPRATATEPMLQSLGAAATGSHSHGRKLKQNRSMKIKHLPLSVPHLSCFPIGILNIINVSSVTYIFTYLYIFSCLIFIFKT